MANKKQNFYVQVMGEVQGPFSGKQVKELAATGRLFPDSFVKNGSDGNWVAADRIKGISFGQHRSTNATVGTSLPQTAKPTKAKPKSKFQPSKTQTASSHSQANGLVRFLFILVGGSLGGVIGYLVAIGISKGNASYDGSFWIFSTAVGAVLGGLVGYVLHRDGLGGFNDEIQKQLKIG
ncbi:DUF4339 domain-containing protein [bacterium]|nr:DUF4339 domain-containing protein [bacterium]